MVVENNIISLKYYEVVNLLINLVHRKLRYPTDQQQWHVTTVDQ